MKRSTWAFPALVSAGLCSLALGWPGTPAARPRYGGTVRMETPASLRTLDPSATPSDPIEAAERASLLPLVFETLVRVDPSAGLQPLLADSWESDGQQKRWQFRLHAGVKLQDGTPLTAAHVATALRQFNAAWAVKETGEGVQIESDQPMPGLPWDLADPRRAIALTGAGALPLGTGPFRIDRWDVARRLVLAANNDYRGGRPFVDAVQIDMARPLRDEIVDLELGRADIVSLLPQDVRRVSQRGLRLASSRPMELLALAFDPRRPVAASDQVRRALALAIDSSAICSVLLQRQGEPARAILPDWLSGYASLFPRRFDRGAARSIAASLPQALRTLSLDYVASDPLAQAIAERLAVDARDAGLTLTSVPPATGRPHPPDVRLVRAMLDPTTPDRALAALAPALGIDAAAAPPRGAPLEAVYRFELSLLDRDLVIPLVHLPQLYGIGARLELANRAAALRSDGLQLADAWLRPEKP